MGGLKGEFVWELAMEEPVELTVRSRSGDVDVGRGPPGRVTVRGTYLVHAFPASRAKRLARLLREAPPVEVHGREVRVGDLSKYAHELGPSVLGWVFEGIEIDYEIRAPKDTEARIEAGSGDVRVSEITGPLEVRTGSGDVELEDIDGDVRVSTGSGDVGVRDVSGDLAVNTGSGEVRSEGVRGEVEIVTGSGDIEAERIAGDLTATTGSGDIRLGELGGDVEVRTGSGDIELNSDIPPGRNWRLRTGSGDAPLYLPEGASFRLDTETRFGEVHSDFPSSPDASAAIEIKTGSGDIRIESKGR